MDTIEILYDGFVRYEKQKGYVTCQSLAQTIEWEEYITKILALLEERKKVDKSP